MVTDRDWSAPADPGKPASKAGDKIGVAAAAADKIGTAHADGAPRVVTSESLLGGATQLAILHDRTLYYLRQTRFGKLILTK